MSLSIKSRIYLSFFFLVFLFVVNGFITISTINYSKGLSEHISEVLDPSLQTLEEVSDMVVHSKMYTTNWVFLRSNQGDKNELIKLHATVFPALKLQMEEYSTHWKNKNWVDSLNKIFTGFEQLVFVEKNIIAALSNFEDYDNPVNKLGAEAALEDKVLPKTTELMGRLDAVIRFGKNIKLKENIDLERASMRLRFQIIFLIITIIAIGIFLSLYMAGRIITPVNKIRL
ncbi:MAG: hypothetical protein ABUT20_61500, partial [Bacteroidota bacterium]